jgi:hypothetical protein
MSLGEVEKGRLYKDFSANSLVDGTGNCKHRTGNFFGGTANFQERSSELIEAQFFAVARSFRVGGGGSTLQATGRRMVI